MGTNSTFVSQPAALPEEPDKTFSFIQGLFHKLSHQLPFFRTHSPVLKPNSMKKWVPNPRVGPEVGLKSQCSPTVERCLWFWFSSVVENSFPHILKGMDIFKLETFMNEMLVFKRKLPSPEL